MSILDHTHLLKILLLDDFSLVSPSPVPNDIMIPIIKMLPNEAYYTFSGLDTWKAYRPDEVPYIVLQKLCFCTQQVNFFHLYQSPPSFHARRRVTALVLHTTNL